MLRLARLQRAVRASSGAEGTTQKRRRTSCPAPATTEPEGDPAAAPAGDGTAGWDDEREAAVPDNAPASRTEEASDDEDTPRAFNRVGEKHKIVRALRAGECFLLHGRALLRVLEGGVRVLGYPLREGPTYRALYAPRDFAALAVEVLEDREAAAAGGDEAASDDEAESDEEGGLLAAAAAAARSVVERQGRAVAAVVALKCSAADGAAWARGAQVAGVPRHGPGNRMLLPGMQEVSEHACRPLRVPPDWKEAAADAVGPGAAGAAVAVCGAKDSGKSMLCRYLVNRALAAHGRVWYLETDLGQGELAPAGLVALHALTRPLLGPPHTHLRPPLRAVFVGETTPARDPALYVRAVHHVLAARETAGGLEAAGAPLVVNTHGWVHGLGREVLLDVLRAVRPAAVLHLAAAAGPARRALAPLDPAAFAYPPPRLVRLRSAPGTSRGGGGGAVEARTLMLAAYLARCSPLTAGHGRPPPPCSPVEARELVSWAAVELCRVAPFAVPVSALRLHLLHSPVPRSEAYRALNAALVALVADSRALRSAPSSSAADGPHPLPRFLTEPPLCHCEGLGIVRAIDGARGVLHVLTPVPAARLARVNTLVRGAVLLPPALLARGPSTEEPYVVSERLAAASGAAPLRPRPNLPRRRLTSGPA